MTSSETRLYSGKGTLGFEIFGALFVNLAFKDFRKAGQKRYRPVAVWVQSVSPFEEGDDGGSFPIFEDLRRYVRQVEQASNRGCNNCADNFRNRVPDCLAQLIYRGPDFASLSEHQLSVFG